MVERVLISVDAVAIPTLEMTKEAAGRAFEDLYVAHAARALRLATMLTGSVERGEDVAATAMVKVYRRWVRGGVEEFWPYLRVAVVNEFRSAIRRDRSSDRDVPELATGDDVADLVGDRTVLLAALASLPARQRGAIALRYLEDLSERDVAALLRCELGTVKSSVSRGLVALRTVLGGDHG